MSPVQATVRRTMRLCGGYFSFSVLTSLFFAAAGALFAFNLEASEGGAFTLPSVWAVSVAPFLPALAAFLAMDSWSDEFRTGRIDMLLSIPVHERDLVAGKFIGIWLMLAIDVAVALLSCVSALYFFAPEALSGTGLISFLPALFGLLLQGALWCAVSVAVSSLCRHATVSVCVSMALMVALPRAGWKALMSWAPQGRPAFGEMPLDAQISDFASGVISLALVVAYAIAVSSALFISSQAVASRRFIGKKSFWARFSYIASSVLAVVCAVPVISLLLRFDAAIDIPVGRTAEFSPRMRHVLSESSGNVGVTCFMSRSDASFRPTAHFLRGLKRQAEAAGGARLSIRYVDPHWDFGAAERLIKLGAEENSIVFEKGRRFASLPLKDGLGDQIVASAIQRVTMPPQRREICWTDGHGEIGFDVYDVWGMSDIARELSREGYRNSRIDLLHGQSIPSDCALIVVAGAKTDFSRAELGRIDSYLKNGGRMLVLMGAPGYGGVSSLLPAWGIRAEVSSLSGAKTLSGSDVIVSDFADHAISASLEGARIVLEKPLSFVSSGAAIGAGADKINFTPVATVSSSAVAAVVERGGGAGTDLAIRPTRIVVVGDAGFVMNGHLASRANANRDFFLNAVAYLSGTDVPGASGIETDILATGMDRYSRFRFMVAMAIVFPLAMFALLALGVLRRRCRR